MVLFTRCYLSSLSLGLKSPLLNTMKLYRTMQSFDQLRIFQNSCSISSQASPNFELFKLNSPEFYSIFTPELKKLDSIFRKHGHELRVVGGAVRDLLMGLRPADLDLSTTANPSQMKEIFAIENIRIVNNKGEKHGTLFVRVNDRSNFEITSLRIDVSCNGRHAEVEFISDWGLDATRRDLTINALYLGLDGTVYDYVGGYEDLVNKRILFVGDPEKRIEEDFLRIMRYFRFFGRISTSPTNHDMKTLDAIKRKMDGLSRISGERIWFELSRIFLGKYQYHILCTMLDVGIAQYIGLDEKEKLDMDYFLKICNANYKYCFKPISFIAALFLNEEQVTRFHERVRISSYDRDLAYFLLYHKSDGDYSNKIKTLQSLQYLLACTKIAKPIMHEYILELLKFKQNDELLKEFEAWKLPPLPISTSQIRLITKLKKSDKIHTIRHKIMENWILSNFQLTSEELISQIPDIVSSFEADEKKK